MRVLIVEDHAKLAEHIRTGAQKEGITIDHVGTAAEADVAIATTGYDAIILDLGLPDQDGGAWLKALRASGDSRPVLVLTARDDPTVVANTLNLGADDYLRKPFEMTEMIARLRALARRPGTLAASVIVEGNLSLDVAAREVCVDGARLELGRREIDGLELLLRRTGRVVPKSALESALYGHQEEVSANAIEVLIHRIRKRLGEANAAVSIHTLRGVGYVLSEMPG